MRKASEKKTKVTSLRLTEQQHNEIKALAEQRHMTMGEYIVDRVTHDNSTLSPESMVKIQNLVNKACRYAAQFDAEALQDEVNEILSLLK